MSTKKLQIRSTFKHASIFSISNILQKAVGFFMLPIYASYLGTEGYGIIGVISIIVSVMGITTGQGISSAMQRHYFEKKTNREQNVLVSTSLLVSFFIVFLTCLPVLIFSKYIALLVFNNIDYGFFVILAVFTFMGDMNAVVGEQYFLIKQQTVFVVIISVVKLVLGLLLNIYLIVYLQLGVLGVLYSGLVCALFFSLTYCILIFSKIGFHFNKSDSKQLLSFSLPLIPSYFFMFARNNVDKIMITSFLGISTLGVYTMLIKFASLIDLFFRPLNKIWSIKRLEICDEPSGRQLIARAFTIQLALLLLAGSLLTVEIPLVIKILTPQDFWVPTSFVLICIYSRLLNFSYYHFVFGLVYKKKTYKISIIHGLTAVTSAFLTFFLVKYYSIIGALTAMILIYILQCILAFFFSRKYYAIPFEWSKIFILLIGSVIVILAVEYLCKTNIDYFLFISQKILSISENISLYQMLEDKIGNYSSKLPIIIEAIHRLFAGLFFLIFLIANKIIPFNFMSLRKKNFM